MKQRLLAVTIATALASGAGGAFAHAKDKHGHDHGDAIGVAGSVSREPAMRRGRGTSSTNFGRRAASMRDAGGGAA